MTASRKILVGIALAVGLFEAVSTFVIEEPLVAATFALVFLVCAWALWARRSRAPVVLLGLFLLVDVAGVPFYSKSGIGDWALQLSFGAVGLLGLVACVNVLREGRTPVPAVA